MLRLSLPHHYERELVAHMEGRVGRVDLICVDPVLVSRSESLAARGSFMSGAKRQSEGVAVARVLRGLTLS